MLLKSSIKQTFNNIDNNSQKQMEYEIEENYRYPSFISY